MKKIAIVMREMSSGGTEIACLNLLNVIKEKYDITLYLINKRGAYAKDIPKNIKIVEMFDNERIKILDPIIDNKKVKINLKLSIIFKKIMGKFYRKKSLLKYYEYIDKYSFKNDIEYDYCIDFHGYGYYGSYYAINNIKANKKITFIHAEDIHWIKPICPIFQKFDEYFCVSNNCAKILETNYQFTIGKTRLCRNVLNIQKILNNAEEKINFPTESDNIILTIGRLEYEKGYDLLIDVSKILKNKNISFVWYIIGDGSLHNEIQKKITDNKLDDNVVLLGLIKNPYPYIKKCNIYAQTSLNEGYGIAIAEARILCKPIISTDIESIREQLENGKNGILSKHDKNDYSEKLIELISNKKLQQKLITNLKKVDNIEKNDFEMLVR